MLSWRRYAFGLIQFSKGEACAMPNNEWTKTAITLFEQIVVWQREAGALLREVKADVAALDERFDRLEKSIEGQITPPGASEPRR
jgi:hypothetical protein